MSNTLTSLATLLACTLLMSGCSIKPPQIFKGDQTDSAPDKRLDPNAIPDAIPRDEPRSKRGNPKSYVVFGKRYYVMPSSEGYNEKGIASWYGTKFHGRLTSSGEPYDMYKMTAAHKSLPLPTYVEVKNLRNGRRAVVKVNDRGPFHGKRIIDLSYAAATKLGILGEGTGLVQVRALGGKNTSRPPIRPESPAPSSSPQQNPTMYLQVGAFGNPVNAERLKQRITQQINAPVRVQSGNSAGATVYRVQIGPFSEVDALDSLDAQLNDIGIEDSHVVIQ